MVSYYNYFRNLLKDADVKKLVDDFMKKHRNEILRSWLTNSKFCKLEDYNTSACDEHLVSADIAREVVQPFYNFVEKIENELKHRLFMMFIEYDARCSTCRYFMTGREAAELAGRELSHDEGYCTKHHRVVSDDDLCNNYEPYV